MLFAPGARDPAEIRTLVEAVAPKPLNLLVVSDIGLDADEIGALGVRRIFPFAELIREGLAARNDHRKVVVDPAARYFGAKLGERSLIPAGRAQLGEIRFQEWLARSSRTR